jgi:methylenetetrahydrofolate dehydrogenase (NADP+)/methenyltetrahydrofolate cyclohydrolase
MTAAIIDGRASADRVQGEVRERVTAFVQQYGRPPGLHVVLVGDDPASHVYVRNKEQSSVKCGMHGAVHRLPTDASQSTLLALVEQLNRDPLVDGILVQMPLPKHIDAETVIGSIDARKDVDGLTPMNAGLLVLGRPGLVPCTPLGCMRLLDEVGCTLEGKHAVVIGRSSLVGKPMAHLLLARHATVTIAHSRTRDLPQVVAQADVVVAAVGKEALVRGAWIKPGAVVIDVGMNRNAEGKLCGDVEFEAARTKASFITPVPKGVGPMTVAMLLSNTLQAAAARLIASKI